MENIICITNRILATGCTGEEFFQKNNLEHYLARIENAAKSGAFAIVLREKDLTEEEYETLAPYVIEICRKYQTECILHNFIRVAKKLHYTKIQLSFTQFMSLGEREKESFEKIGVSVHSREEAILAQEEGASYLVAGHIFQTDCKKGVPGRGLSFLRDICEQVSIPVYAIGGIDPENMQDCLENGAAGVCMMSGFMRTKIYFAPMEGITGYIFRNAYEKIYGNIDKYFTPFISPTSNRCFTNREKTDVLEKNNQNMNVVPQILAKDADLFIKTAGELQKMGYNEVNLNLGCPSGTVVSKGKGSGFLGHPDELEVFLEKIYDKVPMKISIKTRIGKDDPEEFEKLLGIFKKFPVAEMIIHPRVRCDMYENKPNLEAFGLAVEELRCPVCYNGDILTIDDYEQIVQRFPTVDRIMIGRGLLQNPELPAEIRGKKESTLLKTERLKEFCHLLTGEYTKAFRDEKNVLFKMKQLWVYLGKTKEYTKELKAIKKARSIAEYQMAESKVLK